MKCPNLPSQYLPPFNPERFEDWIEELRFQLSKIERHSRWDYNFVRRLIAEKRAGRLRLTTNAAERVRKLHIRYVWQPTQKTRREISHV